MKKFNQFTAAIMMMAALMISVSARATIWRVNNSTGAAANFTTAQAAHNAASAGDSIYFESSNFSYGDLNCTKKIILIGTGYFLSENPETQASLSPATLGSVYFYAGSANSSMMGLTVSSVVIRASSIVISRNRIIGYCQIKTYDSYNGGGMYLHDIVISKNYIEGSLWEQNDVDYTYYVSNLVIENNICNSGISLLPNSVSLILNNVLTYGNIDVYNSQLSNNIQCSHTFNARNNTYLNNIGYSTQFGNLNGNQQNVNMATVFICYSSCTGWSTDGRWQLKAGSPAIGTGVGGVDCGAFGGTSPYVLSGMPNIPAIYSYILFNNSNLLNVNLKVKSHN